MALILLEKLEQLRYLIIKQGNILLAIQIILIPLLVNSFRRAEELALAINARCLEGSTKRTRLKKLKCSWRDLVAVLLFIIGIGAALVVRYAGVDWIADLFNINVDWMKL